MEIIAIFTRKGGVGKTVTSINVASCLDYVFKNRVLLVDCDPQMNLTTCFTLNSDKDDMLNVADIFSNKHVSYKDYLQDVQMTDKNDRNLLTTNIKLVPGTKELDSINTSDMYVLKDFLDVFKNDFDYCLIDCPPSLTDTTINVLCATDFVLIPSFAGRDSINGYGMVVDEINSMKENGYNHNARILGMFLNAVDKRRSLETYYASLWKEDFADFTFKSQIRDASDVGNAYEFGKSVFYFKPNSPVAKDYVALTKEIMTKITKIRKGDK